MDNDKAQSAAWIQFLAWVELNKKRLIIAGVLLAVAIFAGVMIIKYQKEKEARASQALSNVRLPYSPVTQAPSGAADQLLKVAEEHAGTKAAPRALLMSAGILFMEGNYSEAERRFAQVTRDYPGSPWLAEAAYGVAMSLNAAGQTNEAIAKFEEIRRRYANSGVIDQTKLALARLYEQTKPEEAYQLYDELIKSNDPRYSGLGNEAGMNQEDLIKRHPGLAKLREPVMPPPTAALTNRMVVTNPPLMLDTNFLRQAMSNAATKVATATNAAALALTNRVATNLPLLAAPPTQPPPPTNAPPPTTK
jgi:outer membrane protein assembly factor BamD (BamD/ComL family)